MKHRFFNIKGLKHLRSGSVDLAIECFQKSLTLDANYFEATYNLGLSYHQIGQLDLAIRSYKKAVLINPIIAIRHNNKILSVIHLFMEGLIPDAIDTLNELIQQNPNDALLYNMMGGCFTRTNQIDKAVQSYKLAIKLKPNYSVPIHMLNSLTGYTSEEPPMEYVRNLFDDYAESYDESMLNHLEYNLPFIIKDIILKLDHGISDFDKAIDLGCGTGLAGKDLKSLCENLSGIDISENMVDRAKKLNIYDNLFVGDIVDKLTEINDNFDLFVSLDVLIYVGDLKSIFHAIRKRCNKNALFIFSIEVQDKAFSLQKSARYAHSNNYILEISANIFELLDSQNIRLRKEGNEWIEGKVYVLRAK